MNIRSHAQCFGARVGHRNIMARELEKECQTIRRILVVDDNRDAADSLALFLELAGHDVAVAYSGAEALRMASNVHPQLLLLDIGMPAMNGYELAAQLQRFPWVAGATLVAVTGWGQEEDRTRARAAGFDHHMTKPIDPAAIQSLLHEIDQRAVSE